MTPQKRNKIIVLSAVLVVILLVIGIIKNPQLFKTKPVVAPKELTDREILDKDCPVLDRFVINICSYSLSKKAIPLGDVRLNSKNPSHLQPGDLIIIKMNPQALFNNPDLSQKPMSQLGEKLNICFEIHPLLESQQFTNNSKLVQLSPSYFCLPSLTSQDKEVISVTGLVPYPLSDSQLIIKTWLVSDEVITNKIRSYPDPREDTLLSTFPFTIDL